HSVSVTSDTVCYLLYTAWRNSVTHGSQGWPGGGGQMSAEKRSHGGCSGAGEIPLVTCLEDQTPLHIASRLGKTEIPLLNPHALTIPPQQNGLTPLHVAAHYDNQKVALLLLDKGASPHAMAKNGYTPLHIAAKKNQMDIATVLLQYGAETNILTNQGVTPLHLASQEGHTHMTALLISKRAQINVSTKVMLTTKPDIRQS
uniref:Uncharacterized protein n=1 Tax=Poecilia reticulata TaxID=8081 RepID=A0A3P9QCS6_POERE